MPASQFKPLARLVILLLAAWGILTIRVGVPWLGAQDQNGVWISSAVRNYRLYGTENLGYLQVINEGPATPATYAWYIHHPPLFIWTLTLLVNPLGFTEASLRVVTAAMTLIGVTGFYVVCRRLYGEKRAWWSSAVYAFVPMMAYYGRMPDHEAPALALSMLFVAGLVNWLRHPTRGRWLALAALAWLAIWTAWSAMLYIGIFGLVAFWLGSRPQRRTIFWLGVVAVIALVTLLGFYQLQHGDTLRDLRETFLWRTSNQTGAAGTVDFGAAQFLMRLQVRLVALVTPGVVILSIIGLFMLRRHDTRFGKWFFAAFAGVGVGYLRIFRNAAYIHEYYSIFLIPPIAVAASAALVYPVRRWQRFARPVIVGLLLSSVIAGGYFLSFLHNSGNFESELVFAQHLNANTTPDELVLTNVELLRREAVEYYAFRNIKMMVEPDDARAMMQASTQPSVYVYCGDESALPVDIETGAYAREDGCLFSR